MGIPFDVRRGFLRYCVRGGGEYRVGEPTNGAGALRRGDNLPTVILIATSHRFRLQRVGPGVSARMMHRRFPHARRVGRAHGVTLWSTRPGADVVFGTRRGRVVLVAVYDRHVVHGRSRLVALVGRSL